MFGFVCYRTLCLLLNSWPIAGIIPVWPSVTASLAALCSLLCCRRLDKFGLYKFSFHDIITPFTPPARWRAHRVTTVNTTATVVVCLKSLCLSLSVHWSELKVGHMAGTWESVTVTVPWFYWDNMVEPVTCRAFSEILEGTLCSVPVCMVKEGHAIVLTARPWFAKLVKVSLKYFW